MVIAIRDRGWGYRAYQLHLPIDVLLDAVQSSVADVPILHCQTTCILEAGAIQFHKVFNRKEITCTLSLRTGVAFCAGVSVVAVGGVIGVCTNAIGTRIVRAGVPVSTVGLGTSTGPFRTGIILSAGITIVAVGTVVLEGTTSIYAEVISADLTIIAGAAVTTFNRCAALDTLTNSFAVQSTQAVFSALLSAIAVAARAFTPVRTTVFPAAIRFAVKGALPIAITDWGYIRTGATLSLAAVRAAVLSVAIRFASGFNALTVLASTCASLDSAPSCSISIALQQNFTLARELI